MPPRNRKKAPAPLGAEDSQSAHAAVASNPPEVASRGPRRSSRRSGRSPMTREKGASNTTNQDQVDTMDVSEASLSTAPVEHVAKQLENEDSDAAKALRRLGEMETSFKKDIKRRRLQIEESMVEDAGANRSAPAMRSRVVRSASDVVHLDHVLLTPDEEKEHAWEPPVGGESVADDEPLEVVKGANRPPAVNSDYLPLPWRGRLGYACLNTYLRAAKPPVFSSRTCRIASILEHRHPLADPSQPEHPTKNRPDRTKKAEISRGQRYVENLGLANAKDIVKMLQWNEKFGIKFMRLSSEMFPFASHEEYGYKLAPFASVALADAGKIAADFGHRLTTHPGQLGSPRKQVVTNAIRDLEYHDELLSLLKLPPQQDRDAIMILHMGGTFPDAGGKPATLDRFRQNYASLSESIKRRLVLENDDVSWSVHDLLPICEELNIPMVLDYHHHNIVFDADQIREGTYDISQPEIMERITRTWTRKGIKQKMHYSEPCYGAVTPRDRRKHSPRVATLPPCPPDTDLMIEAKDKEQAVFELMRRFKLPGFDKVADMVAHERGDQDRPPEKVKKTKKPSSRKKKRKASEDTPGDTDGACNIGEADFAAKTPAPDPGLTVTPEEFGMGGPLGRVYWPIGFEDWLFPKKREKKVKVEDGKA
ncbi:UV-damage endonuclease [Diaporthe amygdali]|uniref:UV-damage endonuclease n=1 Tax=Phomopsis amygdali TaxID=1214568 RepID=UPI0022FED70F|nr:UV-damage endonuclease [Diaporthe amygdali]KAJ0114799.1 UV-damage endonuclease [Diaporthe amygdali]